jgi:hypothetical protein
MKTLFRKILKLGGVFFLFLFFQNAFAQPGIECIEFDPRSGCATQIPNCFCEVVQVEPIPAPGYPDCTLYVTYIKRTCTALNGEVQIELSALAFSWQPNALGCEGLRDEYFAAQAFGLNSNEFAIYFNNFITGVMTSLTDKVGTQFALDCSSSVLPTMLSYSVGSCMKPCIAVVTDDVNGGLFDPSTYFQTVVPTKCQGATCCGEIFTYCKKLDGTIQRTKQGSFQVAPQYGSVPCFPPSGPCQFPMEITGPTQLCPGCVPSTSPSPFIKWIDVPNICIDMCK